MALVKRLLTPPPVRGKHSPSDEINNRYQKCLNLLARCERDRKRQNAITLAQPIIRDWQLAKIRERCDPMEAECRLIIANFSYQGKAITPQQSS